MQLRIGECTSTLLRVCFWGNILHPQWPLLYSLRFWGFPGLQVQRESSFNYVHSRAVVLKGYELLLLAVWEVLLVPQMTKPKLAYLFFS